MPFPIKIQPIDIDLPENFSRPAPRSRLKRLFDRQFSKSSAVESPPGHVGVLSREGSLELDPSSVCLQKMVNNFIEDTEKESSALRGGRNRCNCFHGNFTDSSDDERDFFDGCFGGTKVSSPGETCEMLKNLVLSEGACERKLQVSTAKLVEKIQIYKLKGDVGRKIVADGLLALGYDASICKSRWEKSSLCPAGEYEYIDVMIKGVRLLIDIDFRSEFQIARPTKSYKLILQTLPHIFVGNTDRLQKIVSIVSEAAKQSLKKRGMHIPPWRKAEFVKSKWLSSHVRASENSKPPETESKNSVNSMTKENNRPNDPNNDGFDCSSSPLGVIFPS